MKTKKMVAMAVGIALAITVFVGCAAPAADATQAQLEQMQKLTEEISSLKAELEQVKQGTPSDTPQAPAEKPSVAPAAESAQQSTPPVAANAATKTVKDYDTAGFVPRVEEMVKRAGAAVAADYGTVKRDMNALEDEMELMEDQAERDFRQGLLSRQDYRQVESELDHMEKQLSMAEDEMEFRLGYDD